VSACEENAYVLHVRPYTDSRVLIDFLTENTGVIRAVGRAPGKRQRGSLQNFQHLHIRYRGDSALKTLMGCEQESSAPMLLTGDALYCGIYLNELLQRLLMPEDPARELFHFYENTLHRLLEAKTREQLEIVLRQFEFFLLEQLGFSLQFDVCASTGEEIRPEGLYIFEVESGFREIQSDRDPRGETGISGGLLLAVARNDWDSAEVLRIAKRLSRQALKHLLGNKPLHSKELFR
jgi:DNA repair protein RecO (recombination protein O)